MRPAFGGRIRTMRNIRIVLWAVVVVLVGVVSWLTLEMTKTREEMVETAYGVPFELTAQNGQPITEKAFQGSFSVSPIARKSAQRRCSS